MSDTDDVVLVGAGIMSTTLGVMLGRLPPGWRITVVERLGGAGLCEFNYTPRRADGTVDVSSTVEIGERYFSSLRFWAHLVEAGLAPGSFIRSVPHMGFGRGTCGG